MQTWRRCVSRCVQHGHDRELLQEREQVNKLKRMIQEEKRSAKKVLLMCSVLIMCASWGLRIKMR